jgi:hypothetical protein
MVIFLYFQFLRVFGFFIVMSGVGVSLFRTKRTKKHEAHKGLLENGIHLKKVILIIIYKFYIHKI